MASPFTLGGFVGWAVVGEGVLFAINQNYPDLLEKFGAGNVIDPGEIIGFGAGVGANYSVFADISSRSESPTVISNQRVEPAGKITRPAMPALVG